MILKAIILPKVTIEVGENSNHLVINLHLSIFKIKRNQILTRKNKLNRIPQFLTIPEKNRNKNLKLLNHLNQKNKVSNRNQQKKIKKAKDKENKRALKKVVDVNHHHNKIRNKKSQFKKVHQAT